MSFSDWLVVFLTGVAAGSCAGWYFWPARNNSPVISELTAEPAAQTRIAVPVVICCAIVATIGLLAWATAFAEVYRAPATRADLVKHCVEMATDEGERQCAEAVAKGMGSP